MVLRDTVSWASVLALAWGFAFSPKETSGMSARGSKMVDRGWCDISRNRTGLEATLGPLSTYLPSPSLAIFPGSSA
jgi:hypothetical protein